MGRSKFPGKPSKHCHRKRINIFPLTTELNASSNDASSMTGETSKENKKEDDLSENESESTALTEELEIRRNKVRKKLNKTINRKDRQKNFMSICNKAALNNRKTKRKLVRNDTTNFAGKFILPTRSVHSSRVIKPNKRFIDLNETINIKQKVLTKKRSRQTNKEINNDSKDKLAYSNGHKVILRQARLKLPNQGGNQMPFTTKLHNGPGTIICGVCGAVRYYRFVKQARKFNIYSCESCRKFISKQIKRLNVGTKGSNVLSCQVGQGTCYVPPVVRSQHWKIAKCAYRSRCSACWLKMSIRAYHLPITLKQNLTELLPNYMQGFDFSFNDSVPPILWQKHIENPVKTIIKQRPIRFKPPQKNQFNRQITSSDIKRQKINLKGPRVKHVCRSASVVLGQPVATFTTDLNNKKTDTDLHDNLNEKSPVHDVLRNSFHKIDATNITDEETASNNGDISSYFEQNGKDRWKLSEEEPSSDELPHCTSILLNYSHELNYENRFRNGFSVVTSETVTTNPTCFLCGSAGIEYMLICAVCCELYHSFCIENFRVYVDMEYWICIKCVPCHKCKSGEKSKITCPKCMKSYHIECFNSKEDVKETISKLICKECTKCQNCGLSACHLTYFPGNMPLCLNCINIKKVDMKCPICQHSVDENVNQLKMLTCSKCKKWVHSKCEKLTNEQYDIIKFLPDSANFTCSQCLKDAQSTLLRSIQNELSISFNRVLKLLMKNKIARNIIKTNGNQDVHFRRQLFTNFSYMENNNYDVFSFAENRKYCREISSLNALMDIKNNLNGYNSVKKFNNDMREALKLFHSEQIFAIYENIFQSVFPWFSDLHESDKDIEQFDMLPISYKYNEVSFKMPTLPRSKSDDRICVLCHVTGDQLCHQESRLLFCGNDKWVHANCAYWSTDVYEDLDNHLQNVIETIEKNKFTKCFLCEKLGASLQCEICKSHSFHFMCARKSNFIFTIANKACFCSKHVTEKIENVITENDNFQLNRSIFIEPYPKDKLRAVPEKILCTIGSLWITTLGKIEPSVSDTIDALIPTGFVCRRIFWSTIEPWKLVTYLIKTSILNPNCSTLSVDKNFTIDHSLDIQEVEKAVKDLSDWQKVYDKKIECIELEDEVERNASELLSPELTDTILEDLPNDILDGILVHDLFPNFNYDDMLAFDSSSAECIPDAIKKFDDDYALIDSDSMTEPKDYNKTKSDLITKSRVPPLSLTLSYKFDSNISSISKKRKIHKDLPNNMLLLQVDGNFDDDSSSDCNSPNVNENAIDLWTIAEQPVTCEKCQCTYRTQASYTRHLDTCEVLCMSESDSEVVQETDAVHKSEKNVAADTSQPVEVTFQLNETSQPVLLQAYESYQSQVHTSVVNVVSETCPLSQSQPVAIQQPTITLPEPQSQPSAAISISVPLCVTPQIVQSQPLDFHQSPSMSLQPLQQVIMPRPPKREAMVLHQMPSQPTTGFVPYVDTFSHTQPNQNVQYVQIAPQVQPQSQILQIRSDGQVIGLMPSIQPTTVIVQPPQQLLLDGNGTFGWTQQPQHQIYYGFETIVQNTIMQSQQFLPTPVPGVLTANSSYSTTTQVFQTSKLEPVLDVPSNGFVLVNTNQMELPQQFPDQNQSAAVVTAQAPPTIMYSQESAQKKAIAPASNCINLPTAPFISDQNIPMNIVPPIPKLQPSHNRPMNRVLPMQTNATKKIRNDISKIFPEIKKPVLNKIEDQFIESKNLVQTVDNPRNKKSNVEILDCKFITSRNNVSNVNFKQNSKINEKPFKESESINNVSKLTAYEPLKEIEIVEREILDKPIKSLVNKDHYIDFNSRKKFNQVHTTNFDQLDSQDQNKNDAVVSNVKHKRQFELTRKKTNTEKNLQKSNQSESNVIQKAKKDSEINRYKKAQFQFVLQNETKLLQTLNNNFKLIIKSPTKDKMNSDSMKKSLDMPKLGDFDEKDEKTNSESENTLMIDNNAVENYNSNLKEKKNYPPSAQKLPVNTNKVPAVITPLRVIKNIKNENEIPRKMNTLTTNSVGKPQSKKESNCCAAPAMLYTIENQEGFKYSSTSISECWVKVWEAVQNARMAHNMPPLPTDGKPFKSVQLMGLKSSQVKYLLEQLPGASKCIKYKNLFSFSPHPFDIADSSSHEFGAIRCKPHLNRNNDPSDMFSWLSSKHRKPFMSLDGQIIQSRRVNSFPLAMKFRNLKQTCRWSVGVYRSDIHGKGLFCLRDIESGEMVIEYAGEVIRSILTDKREKYYNSKGIGCYMFRVDDNLVIDATMKGNAARFINHSCDPNCYSKVVEIQGHKHIIIFALRRISSGEELTYDYKFPFEEDKILCTCGARKCRKFLN